MFNVNVRVIGVIIVVGVVLLGMYLFFTGDLSQQAAQEQQQKKSISLPEVPSISGQVISVDIANNSFVLLQSKEDRSFTVQLGKETEFTRVTLPSSLSSPSVDDSSAPGQEAVTIKGLQVGDQVFVRAQTFIKTGQDINNPLEVQVLP